MENQVSIVLSYSHQDEVWKDYVLEHLGVAAKQGAFELWDDRRIAGGEDWRAAIEKAFRQARVAVILLSRHFLNSEFILGTEVPLLIRRKVEEGITVYPILLSACDFDAVPWLKELHIRPNDGRPLAGFSEPDRDQILVNVAKEIRSILGSNMAIGSKSIYSDLEEQLVSTFRQMSSAMKSAEINNKNPIVRIIHENLEYCLDDLASLDGDATTLVTLLDHLGYLTEYARENSLAEYFTLDPLNSLKSMMRSFSEVIGDGELGRISTLENRNRVDALINEINRAINQIGAEDCDLGPNQGIVAIHHLRKVRREVSSPGYRPAVVNESRHQLEELKVNLLERAILLAETLLGGAFPHLPAGAVFRDLPEDWCPQMVMIPAGVFLMGSPATDELSDSMENPQHEVTISQAFALGRYATTFDAYDHMITSIEWKNHRPRDQGWGRGRRPAIWVGCGDADQYCSWLGERTGARYRLPTEAEWEYSCRSGTTTRYNFGGQITKKDANFENVYRKTSTVGEFHANCWGLYDMHGNTWEWCCDGLREYSETSIEDPRGAMNEDHGRIMRGGSWNKSAKYLRSSCRRGLDPTYNSGDTIGFRCARVQKHGS